MTPDLRLTNTLTRRKETFRPIDPAHVRMYACGPTVYDLAHIGNARPVIVFDLLFRLLRHVYGPDHVTYVRNITDVDDKINARAVRDFPALPLNAAIRRVTEATERQFHADIRALGVLMPDDVNVAGQRPHMLEPRATDHIDEMRRLIDRLVDEGHAYAAEGHVLFHVSSMPDYGQLSKRPLDEMEAGARVEIAPFKRSPLDFVLWKPSSPGEPGWPPPAGLDGLGRPGWHIECSAMSWKHLGETFDIHAGGLDLIFPHHENEIAQSRCCFGTPVMANYWLHNGFLQVEGEKMSKSLGNFVTIRDLLATDSFAGRDWPGDTLRLAMLRAPYRDPIDWTAAGLIDAENVLNVWWRAVADVGPSPAPPEEVLAPLLDDLDTPAAITALHALRKEGCLADLHAALLFLGFPVRRFRSGSFDASSLFNLDTTQLSELSEQAVELMKARAAARAAKNWAESDRIRDQLKAMGVQLKDNKDGTTTWEVTR